MATIRSIIHRSLFSSGELQPGEARSAWWSAAMVGVVLGAWYFIRPIRDEIGTQQNALLPHLTTGTFIGMLIAMPIYAWIVKRSSRRMLVPGVYWFVALVLVAFWWLLTHGRAASRPRVERVFYVTMSVFNLFLLSVFWGLMADVFTREQGKRTFGVIAAGGSLGGLIGAAAAALILQPPKALARIQLAPPTMLLIAAAALALAPILLRGIRADKHDENRDGATDETPIRGTVWSSMITPFRSPYLLGVCAYLFLYALTSTFLNYEQAKILNPVIPDRIARTALLARLDTYVNAITLFPQLFVASRSMRKLGVAVTLSVTPALTVLGFGVLMAAPVLSVVLTFQALRRISNFAFARPAREVLFTIVPREDKYKAKVFIDTVVYRGGDVASGWAYDGLGRVGLGLAAIAGVASAVSGLWLAVAWILGRSHQRAVDVRNESSTVSTAVTAA